MGHPGNNTAVGPQKTIAFVVPAHSGHTVGEIFAPSPLHRVKEALMEFSPYLIPGAATMAVLAIVYLIFVYWTRRPGRADELARRSTEVENTEA